jgi:carbonic anhydrase/acetyltransferase-like protein (isoleucine patch superfamily)
MNMTYIQETARIGAGVVIGDEAVIGADAVIEVGARVLRGDTYIAVLGHCEGYVKTLCDRDGVAWINAGCRSFSLDDAISHWAGKEARPEAMKLMDKALGLAREHQLRTRVRATTNQES